MIIRFQPTQFPHGDGVNSLELPEVADETFLRGAVLTLTSGEVAEGVGAPAILGVASHDAGASPSGEQVTYLAEGRQRFLGQAVDGANDILTDLSGISPGDQFKVKAVANEWVVDSNDAVDPHVVITQVIEDLDIVVFRFLDSVITEF